MASDGITVKLEGVDELKRALADASKQIRTKAVRAALRDAGRVIQKAARSNAPVLKTATPNRKPGTVKKAISVRASKLARRDKNEGVFVSVRPLRGSRQKKLGRAGATNPNDPFYWLFQEFGTKPHVIKPRRGKVLAWQAGGKARFARSVKHPGNPPKRFMTRAAESQGEAAIRVFMNRVIPQIERLNAKAARVR